MKKADRQATALRELHKAVGALWGAHAFLPPTHPHVETLRRMQRDAENMLAESRAAYGEEAL